MGFDNANEGLYPFHSANIHERRFAATFFRAFPLLFFIGFLALIAVGIFKYKHVLLATCAVLNLMLWLWISGTACCGVYGSKIAAEQIQLAAKMTKKKVPMSTVASSSDAKSTTASSETGSSVTGSEEDLEVIGCSGDDLQHMIVLPNYKEDEDMLAQTIEALRQAADSSRFRIVLAMEAREKGAFEKGERLKEKFSGCFTWFLVASHPADLMEDHLDGTSDEEVPGKASNLKWGVAEGYKECAKEGKLDLSKVMLTIADADCLFHPGYFKVVNMEWKKLREKGGTEHQWTMWQAPQLPYRNFWSSPIPSRAWGYVSTMYEFGGISSLACGGHHMVFSSYSLPLQLAMNAQAWDGDVIAEDHHAFIKCFYYSIFAAAVNALKSGGGKLVPKLQVKPVFLPVKSTSVVSSDGYWETWVERWHQAKRHTQGVAEFSYAMLAAFDTITSLPFSMQSFYLCFRIWKVVFRLWCMHMLPIVQGIALGALTLYWYVNGRHVPECPEDIWNTKADRGDRVLCGLAGAWCLVWPMLVPLALMTLSNFLFIQSMFIEPGEMSEKSLWHAENGGDPLTWAGTIRKTLAAIIMFDCLVLVGPVMVPYGMVVEIMAYWNVCFRGNKFTYIAASKAMGERTTQKQCYGSMEKDGKALKDCNAVRAIIDNAINDGSLKAP